MIAAPPRLPIAFGPQGALFGVYHPPASGASRGLGVVLCNPLGYESMCVHRTQRRLAEKLADAGFHALRFDYYGTGDSAGSDSEPGRLEAWLGSISLAVDELRARSGAQRIGLFGIRFGATLSARLASLRGDIDDLILWGAFPSGRTWVRELRAFRLLKEQTGQARLRPARADGEEAAGYFFDAPTVSALSGVDLLKQAGRVAERVLVIPRDDLPGGDERLVTHLRGTGASVDLRPLPGYSQVMRDPQDSIVPEETLTSIVEWLGGASTPTRGATPSLPNAKAIFGEAAGAGFQEEAVLFGEGQRLLGVVCRPAAVSPRARPAVLFLNAGANHRIGPNRMHVILARRLALRGYTSLRMDVGGLGDSYQPPGAGEPRLYSKDAIRDVRAAATLLDETLGLTKFIAVGLCSGAYLAFHATVEDPQIVGQILLNPQTFDWKEGDSLDLSIRTSTRSTRYYLNALMRPEVWKRFVSGKVHGRVVARAVATRLVQRAQELAARVRGEAPTDVERAFVAVSDRGVATLLIFSSTDGGIDKLATHLGTDARKMSGRENFRLEFVEDADHTFTPVGSQAELYALVIGEIERRFP